jgi:hypothetical protein
MMDIEVPETCWAYYKFINNSVATRWFFFSTHIQWKFETLSFGLISCIHNSFTSVLELLKFILYRTEGITLPLVFFIPPLHSFSLSTFRVGSKFCPSSYGGRRIRVPACNIRNVTLLCVPCTIFPSTRCAPATNLGRNYVTKFCKKTIILKQIFHGTDVSCELWF